jgi:hypothetical protein
MTNSPQRHLPVAAPGRLPPALIYKLYVRSQQGPYTPKFSQLHAVPRLGCWNVVIGMISKLGLRDEGKLRRMEGHIKNVFAAGIQA